MPSNSKGQPDESSDSEGLSAASSSPENLLKSIQDQLKQINQKSSKKKTVLQVVPALISGGVERGTIEIARALVQNGYNSIVISSGGPLVEELTKCGAIHEHFDVSTKNPFKIYSNSNYIADIIKKYDVDIVHVRSRAPAWSCLLAASKTNRRLITTFHGVYNFSNFIKKYYNSIMTKGDVVIAVSNFVRDHIVKNYGTNETKIRVIHRGVDHNKFSKKSLVQSNLESFKEKYNLPKFDKKSSSPQDLASLESAISMESAGALSNSERIRRIPVILLPARFTEWKGHLWLVQALSQIKNNDFYCIMAGDLAKHPDYVKRLKDLIVKNRMQGKIQIFGNEPDIISLYGLSDIVLSTSIEPEAFGRTIIEAQSMEKLVIATNVGGASETIKNEESGFHVTPGNTEQLKGRIEYCLSIIGTDQEKLITSKARSDVIKYFSLEKMLTKVLEVYEEK